MWGFNQHRSVEVVSHYEPAEGSGCFDVGQFVVARPLVTQWSERGLAVMPEEMGPEALGYRFVRRECTALVSVWARPLVVWLYLMGCEWAARRVWFARAWVLRGWWWLQPGRDIRA